MRGRAGIRHGDTVHSGSTSVLRHCYQIPTYIEETFGREVCVNQSMLLPGLHPRHDGVHFRIRIAQPKVQATSHAQKKAS